MLSRHQQQTRTVIGWNFQMARLKMLRWNLNSHFRTNTPRKFKIKINLCLPLLSLKKQMTGLNILIQPSNDVIIPDDPRHPFSPKERWKVICTRRRQSTRYLIFSLVVAYMVARTIIFCFCRRICLVLLTIVNKKILKLTLIEQLSQYFVLFQ